MEEYLVSEFKKLGVSDKIAVMSVQVYLELTEVKKYWDPTYEYNEELKAVLIKARKTKTEPHLVFLPISVFEELSFDKLQNILVATKGESIFLAILHPDSTCIYYQISKDLVEPQDTSAKHKRVDLREKLDSELRRNKKLLEQAALYGMPVTIVKKGKEEAQKGAKTKEENTTKLENT